MIELKSSSLGSMSISKDRNDTLNKKCQYTCQCIVRTAAKIIGCSLPFLSEIYDDRLLRRARSILKDPSHPGYDLFKLLPSGKRYRCHRARTERLKCSFFPTAIRALNK